MSSGHGSGQAILRGCVLCAGASKSVLCSKFRCRFTTWRGLYQPQLDSAQARRASLVSSPCSLLHSPCTAPCIMSRSPSSALGWRLHGSYRRTLTHETQWPGLSRPMAGLVLGGTDRSQLMRDVHVRHCGVPPFEARHKMLCGSGRASDHDVWALLARSRRTGLPGAGLLNARCVSIFSDLNSHTH